LTDWLHRDWNVVRYSQVMHLKPAITRLLSGRAEEKVEDDDGYDDR